MKRSPRRVHRPAALDLTSTPVRGGASMMEYALLLVDIQVLAAQAYKALGAKVTQQALAQLTPDELSALIKGKHP